jgi:hypothetical protein
VWIGSTGKIFVADAVEGEVKASWRVEKALDKNVNCLLYLPIVGEMWSCGDTDLLYVWKENIWVGKRGIATLEGHKPGSKVFSMTTCKSNCQYVFSGGTDTHGGTHRQHVARERVCEREKESKNFLLNLKAFLFLFFPPFIVLMWNIFSKTVVQKIEIGSLGKILFTKP